MFKLWLCLRLPWHRFVKQEKMSDVSDRVTCSCGRMYGMNHSERIILPWDDVKQLYVDLARIRGAAASNGER